jgi:hypothetical protein
MRSWTHTNDAGEAAPDVARITVLYEPSSPRLTLSKPAPSPGCGGTNLLGDVRLVRVAGVGGQRLKLAKREGAPASLLGQVHRGDHALQTWRFQRFLGA